VRSLRGFEQGDEMRLHRVSAFHETIDDIHNAGDPHVGARVIELFGVPFDQQEVPVGLGRI
jgi:hypothetical protein